MPEDVRVRLDAQNLMHAYQMRPAYQQNDYIGWIERAKRSETRENRISQMLGELERGDVYMKMRWNGPNRR